VLWLYYVLVACCPANERRVLADTWPNLKNFPGCSIATLG
jgi:hypothetical protein